VPRYTAPGFGQVLGRGLAAGAAGTTALNAVTYLDMALRGRPASCAPEMSVDSLLESLGTSVPGSGEQRYNRRTGLGALSGIATGLAVGVATSAARALGVRLPAPVAAVATGAAAMAAADIPMALAGISDPRDWTRADWAADIAPHLAYGLATQAVLRRGVPANPPRPEPVRRRACVRLVARSAVLGVATGFRSSMAFAGPAVTTPRRRGRLGLVTGRPGAAASVLAVGGELVADKLPVTPSRLEGPGLAVRIAAGAGGATALAHREGAHAKLPALVGAAGAAAGSYGGYAWRQWAGRRVPDWQAALVEDAAAVGLAALASLPGRRTVHA
jgi:hypothetical protein